MLTGKTLQNDLQKRELIEMLINRDTYLKRCLLNKMLTEQDAY